MTDLITADEATKLLDGATPGPWEADGDPWNRIIWSSAENRVCFMAHSNGLDDARDIATSNLIAAAPDLARTVIALHAQLADAQAAQAMVVERAEEKRFRATVKHDGAEVGDLPWLEEFWAVRHDDILALSPIDGLALVRELRAERDEARDMLAKANNEFGSETWSWPDLWRRIAQLKDLSNERWQRAEKLEAERDRLAAANAVLEAKVAGLRDFVDDFAKAKIDALRYSPPYGSSPEDEPDPVVDAKTVWAWQADAKAALATQEAGNG